VSNSLVIAFIALELFSIALYVLVAIDSDALPGLEGALGHLVVGSVGAAFLLHRIGAGLRRNRTVRVRPDRAVDPRHGDAHGGVLLLGVAMIIVGLGFTANSAPFHMDGRVQRGAPTPVTAFMSAATKTVALVLTFRVLVAAFARIRRSGGTRSGARGRARSRSKPGGAGGQANVKRMLAYSTVGHTGFLFTAVAVHTRQPLAPCSLPGHLPLMNIGAFALVAIRERELVAPGADR
jgi:NADH-quinone oxidoreductase subunit N